MHIRDIVVTPIAFRDPPLLNAAGLHEPLALRTIVQVELDDGTVGLGEAQGESRYIEGLRLARAAVAGMSVFDTTAILERVFMAFADAGFAASAKDAWTVAAALEVAFLDAQGKALGIPVCDLLGGAVREHVPFSAYLFYKPAAHVDAEPDEWGAALDPDGVVTQAETLRDRYGFASFKLKAGVFPPADEIAAIEALAERFPGHPLRIDPNGAWTVPTAIDAALRLAGKLEYLEDPVIGREAMAEVGRATPIPLATNMCVTAFDEIPDAVSRRSVSVVLADHHYWGGLRRTRELATICGTFGIGVSMHSNSHLGISLQAMTHLAAATPNLSYACDTHYPWNSQDEIVAGGPIPIVNGHVQVTRTPGLGVTVDEAALARAAATYRESRRTTRDDATYMRRYRADFDPAIPRF